MKKENKNVKKQKCEKKKINFNVAQKFCHESEITHSIVSNYHQIPYIPYYLYNHDLHLINVTFQCTFSPIRPFQI
jgi:hypothetical protein